MTRAIDIFGEIELHRIAELVGRRRAFVDASSVNVERDRGDALTVRIGFTSRAATLEAMGKDGLRAMTESERGDVEAEVARLSDDELAAHFAALEALGNRIMERALLAERERGKRCELAHEGRRWCPECMRFHCARCSAPLPTPAMADGDIAIGPDGDIAGAASCRACSARPPAPDRITISGPSATFVGVEKPTPARFSLTGMPKRRPRRRR